MTTGVCACNILWSGASCNDMNQDLMIGLMVGGVFTVALICVFLFSLVILRILGPRVIKTVGIALKLSRNQRLSGGSTLHQKLLINELTALPSGTNEHILKIRQAINPFSWHIPVEDISFNERIGTGGFGDVYKGKLRNSTVVAIKVMRLTANMESGTIEQFISEISIWAQLKHPNIVSFLGACVDTDEVCIISEYMSLGSLNNLFGRRSLSWNAKVSIASDIASAMADLHSRTPPILHRDLKSLNILLDSKLTAKITDFGLSKIVRDADQTMSIVGTPYWSAPELLKGLPYGKASDVYSFGILMFQILMETRKPFDDTVSVHQIAQDGYRPKVPTPDTIFETFLGDSSTKSQDGMLAITSSSSRPTSQRSLNTMSGSVTTGSNSSGQSDREAILPKIQAYIALMGRCWEQRPLERPTFLEILDLLQSMSI